MSPKSRGKNVRKVCACGWRAWPKCEHPWYFTYKPKHGGRHRFSLDAEFNRRIEGKTEAENLAADLRSAINAGTFERVTDRIAREQRERLEQLAREHDAATRPAADIVTVETFATRYLERFDEQDRKVSWGNDAGMFARLGAYVAPDGRRLGEWPLTAITEDILERFVGSLKATFAVSTRNQYVQLLKASFRWAAKVGYIPHSPISGESTILKRGKVAQRRRRLSEAEERALLAAAAGATRGAGVRLPWIIIAAIETGCRRGELLAVRWRDVDLEKRTLLVRAVEEGASKTGRARRLPISTRLAAVLEMAKTDPAGRDYPPTAYVFGVLGARLTSIKKAWETCVLIAHDHVPVWTRNTLSADCRAQLRAIDLHFHDLRHEAGCRWLEAGWPIHHVQEMLGHSSLAQTSTYLHAAEMGLQESMSRFDAQRDKPVAIETTIEHPPLSHDADETDGKGVLH